MQRRLNKLTQVVLGQKQTIASIRHDPVMHPLVKTGENSLIPIIYRAAEAWRTMKKQEPSKLQYSLKLALFNHLLLSFHERLQQ